MYRSERKNIQMYESRIIVNTHKLQDIYRAHILSKKKKKISVRYEFQNILYNT